MLSEISQIQKDKYYMIHLFEHPGIVRLKEGESRMVVAGIWRERSTKGTKFQPYKMKKSQRSTVGHSAYNYQYCIVYLKFCQEGRLYVKCYHRYHHHQKQEGRKPLEVMDLFSIQTAVTVSGMRLYLQPLQVAFIKHIQLFICQSFFSKVVFLKEKEKKKQQSIEELNQIRTDKDTEDLSQVQKCI